MFGLFFNQNQNQLFTDKVIIKAINQAIDKDKRNYYPILEVKVNGVYSLESFPLAVIEKSEMIFEGPEFFSGPFL